MRPVLACILLLGAPMLFSAPPAQGASLLQPFSRPADIIVDVQSRQPRTRTRDCTPTNGPFGFYGNLWCQPANEASYLRNLGSSWPMPTPPSLRVRRPAGGTDW